MVPYIVHGGQEQELGDGILKSRCNIQALLWHMIEE